MRKGNRPPSVGDREYYPVYLDLTGRRAVVVGGGKVAERKILSLLSAGAKVVVISPELTSRLEEERQKETLTHIARVYRRGDIKDAFLVVAATDSPEVNKQVAAHAPALVNVVDVPSQCNFIAPSVVKRGPLQLAISTGGVSPAFARTVRMELEDSYGREFPSYLRFLKTIRAKALAGLEAGKEREAFLKYVASPEMLTLLRSQGLAEVKKRVHEAFHSAAVRSERAK